jgi:AAA domain
MTPTDPQPLPLRPFQAEAVEHFFREDSHKVQVLAGPSGSGKATTASAIVSEALRRGADAIAVLATRNVVAQGIAWRATSVDLTPFELHRAVALSTSTGPVPRWPKRVLTFGSLRQAAREPIAQALATRRWNLVVADVSGGGDSDLDTLHRFLAAAEIDRVLVLEGALTIDSQPWPDGIRLPYAAPGIADATKPPLDFSVVEYERSPAEVDLAGRAQELASNFRSLGLGARMRLPAATASSPLAAQSQAWAAADSLRQLRNRLAHGLTSEPEEKDLPRLQLGALPRLEQLREDLVQFGDDIDSLETDSKWEAFLPRLHSREPQLTVVFCDFAETAVYAVDRLQEAGMEAISLDNPDAFEVLKQGYDGILVARDDKLPGLELRGARLAVNYDLPASQRRAYLRWSRLDWSREDRPVEMVTLLDPRGGTPTERMAVVQLRYLVGGDSD